MEQSFSSRIRNAVNAFRNRDPTVMETQAIGPGNYARPDRMRYSRGNERSLATSVFNRIALDVSSLDIRHCQLDKDGRFQEERTSPLNDCLKLEANLDQTGRAMIQDCVSSMLDEGCVALCPIDTDRDTEKGTFDIYSIRVCKILNWYPNHIRVLAYNERTGKKRELIFAKRDVCIIENPLYAVINEPNSTMQRLMRKLSLLDITDEQNASGKLDLIIQLPYSIKTEARREQANSRMADLENQLARNKYGIAYVDSTEKVTQLNRSVENNLMKQVEYLTETFYSQLGITQSILDGTADEQTMLNYYSRTIEPIVSAIVDEMKRKWLTKTARTQGQTIMFFRDPFKLVPVGQIADIADKFTRNEILTSNEIRQIIGRKPSVDPKADQLINSNLNHPDEGESTNSQSLNEGGENQNE